MGGSVRHAREMLEAGVRQGDAVQNPHRRNDEQSVKVGTRVQNNPNRPPPLRPRRPNDSGLRSSYKIDANEDTSPNGELDNTDVPILPIQGVTVPRRIASLGRPPSSRRGPSSYYSRGPFVSPIPEELNDVSARKKGSFASSAVIPTSWGSGPAESDILGSYDNRSMPDSDDDSDVSAHQEEPPLVRQASLGKRGKPSLRNINKSQPEVTDAPKTPTASIPPEFNGSSDSGVAYSPLNVLDPRTSSDSHSSDDSSFDSEKDLEKGTMFLEDLRRPDPIAAAGPAMSSRIPGSRRPPRLDLDAVRQAESRGSLTSLPDLIRRATRLASNLDRGRTASRLGMLDMLDSARDPKGPSRRQNSIGTLSDILASFPPPRNDTPDDVRGSWPYGNEKSRLREMQLNDQDPQGSTRSPKSGRRCCGMSLPLFIFLCLLVVGLVVAAVIIPVVLVVLPRSKHTTPATSTSLNPCQQSLPCMNGGISIADNGTCSCVCANGFSGAQCAIPSDGSCTTISSSMSSNATIGNALPRLLNQAQANFSIPLDETDILSLLNANNVSCTLQNALVTFKGANQRHRRRSVAETAAILDPTITPAPVPYLERKNAYSSVQDAVATSDGIIYDASPVTLPAPTTTTTHKSLTPTPTPTLSTAASAAQERRDLDFARVAVLYILDQTNNFKAATIAQSSITSFLTSSPTQNGWYNSTGSHMNVTGSGIPSSFVLNFADFTITLANGTIVGGKGADVGNGTVSSSA
jgi:hypothetical protein